MNLDSLCLDFGGGFEDCARLHLGNFRKRDPEPATAMTEHRIELVQLVNTPRDLLNRHTKLVRQLALLRGIVWKKFVQRRIQKADCCGQPF